MSEGVPPGEEFSLGVTESVQLENGQRLTFSKVSDDSRCPRQVQCVWAGDATVVISAGEKTHELHTAKGEPQSFALEGGLTVKLVRLDPYPETPDSISAEDYQATLVYS